MTDSDIEDSFAGAVVDGKFHIDLGNGDIAHDTGTGDVEGFPVAADVIVIDEGAGNGQKPLIVFIGKLEDFLVLVIINLGEVFAVACDCTALDFGVPPVADGWVEHYGEAHQEHKG